MKTLVVSTIAIMAVSSITFRAQAQNIKIAGTRSSENVVVLDQSENPNSLPNYYNCVIIVDGIKVMEGPAYGYSAEEVEKGLKEKYTKIFADDKILPVVVIKCTLMVEKEK